MVQTESYLNAATKWSITAIAVRENHQPGTPTNLVSWIVCSTCYYLRRGRLTVVSSCSSMTQIQGPNPPRASALGLLFVSGRGVDCVCGMPSGWVCPCPLLRPALSAAFIAATQYSCWASDYESRLTVSNSSRNLLSDRISSGQLSDSIAILPSTSACSCECLRWPWICCVAARSCDTSIVHVRCSWGVWQQCPLPNPIHSSDCQAMHSSFVEWS